MLATGSAITHATFVAQNSAVHLEEGKADDYALVFIAPMDTPGKKLVCRRSYEADARSPWENPLSSRFDENDAVVIFDDAFIPWENVLVYRDVEKATGFYASVGVHAPLHAPVGHAPRRQARLPLRPARAGPAGERDGRLPRRAGEARRARRLAEPDLGADGGAVPRADARARGERRAEARVRDADPAVRHAGRAAGARDLRRDPGRRAARDPVECRRPAVRRAAPADRPLLPRVDRRRPRPRSSSSS